MVVFTCNNCGDAVKKPKVDQHITIECGKSKVLGASLCCIDCLRDFNIKTYVDHTKCVTELERYSAPGFVSKPSSNKNERKQNLWIENIRSILSKSDLSRQQRQLLELMSNVENVPRKKSKFQNFIQNSCKALRPRPDLIDSVFILLEKEASLKRESKSGETENGLTDVKNENTNSSKAVKEAENANHLEDVTSEVGSNVDLKKKSKKKRKQEDDSSTGNIESKENHDDGSTIELGKKKKSSNVTNDENTDTSKIVVEAGNVSLANAKSEAENNTADKKKKKRKREEENSAPNVELNENHGSELTMPAEDCDTFEIVKKKKKKKRNHDIENDEAMQVGNENTNENAVEPVEGIAEDLVSGKQVSKKKQKKLKLNDRPEVSVDNCDTIQSVQEDSVIETVTQQNDISLEDSNRGDNSTDNIVEGDEESTENLTRKQKKEKKKKQKLEAEMKAIELEKKLKTDDNILTNDENRKEKKKKRKLTEINENEKSNVSAKKAKLEDDMENDGIENQANDCHKFSWDEIVRSLLEKSDGEMKVKKMTKKVVAEYQACFSNNKSFEEISKKFNKKLIKLPFVSVSKERVVLRE